MTAAAQSTVFKQFHALQAPPCSASSKRLVKQVLPALQVIAYNLCFSTCLGRPQHASATVPIQLGSSEGILPPGTLRGGLHPSR